MPKVLIIEDEISLARSMRDALAASGHEVRLVHVGERVMPTFREFVPQLVLVDVRLGGVNGLDLLQAIKAEAPDTEAIVVTAYGSVEVAVDAMKRGAAEFLTKPIDLDVLAAAIDRVWSASQSRRRLEQFRNVEAGQFRQVQILGESVRITGVRRQIERLVQRAAAASTDMPAILLTGETGTGKDLVANYIHAALPRRTGPFVALNCSAVPRELFESELFGHQRGAFSGATADKPGLFETADGGTLFLDEVGDMPLELQPKLLRALETRTVRRVGETRDRTFDLFLIAATNRELEAQVSTGRFREDLYYRLKVVSIELPPLRDRADDIELLADHFLTQLSVKYGVPGLTLSDKARQVMREYSWPGNVRELQHALESATLTIAGTLVEAQDLPLPTMVDPVRRATRSLEHDQPIKLEEVEKELIQQAMRRTDGNVSAAARLLSIGREALRYRLGKFGLIADTPSEGESNSEA